jgi:glycine dehydrogenase subunit 1
MGFMAGVKVDDSTVMFAVTEQRTKEEIDDLVHTIQTFREDKE